jgi:hypothetical protein
MNKPSLKVWKRIIIFCKVESVMVGDNKFSGAFFALLTVQNFERVTLIVRGQLFMGLLWLGVGTLYEYNLISIKSLCFFTFVVTDDPVICIYMTEALNDT